MLIEYLTIGIIVFTISVVGLILNRKNLIIMLMSIELMLLAISINLVVYSVFFEDLFGEIFTLFILTVAAGESAIGLGILVAYYRVRGTIAIMFINLMKG